MRIAPRTRQLRRCATLLLPALLPLLPLLAASVVAFAARPALAAPRVAPVQQAEAPTVPPTITVSATAGAVKDACDTRTSLTVKRGSIVFTCYTVTNSGPLTFTQVVIDETDAGTDQNPLNRMIIASSPITASTQFTMPGFVAQATVVRVGRIGLSNGPGTMQVQRNTSITVTVVNPAVAVEQTLSTSPSECTSNTSVTVQANAAVYRCITLTNTGDIPLDQHVLKIANTPPGSSATYTLTAPLPREGGVVALTYATASQANKAAFLFNASADTSSDVSVVSSAGLELEFATQAASSSATVDVVNVATTVAAALNNNERCGPSSDIILNIPVNQPVYYCLRLTNTGQAPLNRHTIAMTGQAPVTLDSPLAPNQMLEISTATLAEKGLPPILGPVVVTTTWSTTFVVTSSADGGFQSTTTAPAVSVLASTPTPTPTPAPTPYPSSTPSPTSTPWPVTPTWTPSPTWTPTETLVPPTPTWTRSFELSNLQTPTPRADNGGDPFAPAAPASSVDSQATALAQGDPNAYLTPDPFATPPFDSGLPTPFIDPNAQELIGAALPISDTETPTPPPTATPTLEPTRTPLPTQTPSPTATPTATQRPIVYAAPAPPAGFAGVSTGVLDSTLAAAGILFVATGAVVFFGVLGAVLGFGFLRSSRRPYQLQDADDENPDFMAAPPQSGATGGTPHSTVPGDRWPTSLP